MSVDLLKAILDGELGGAEHLYDRYASGLRSHLRRHTGRAQVENSILTVLTQVSRHVREGQLHNEEDLTRGVLDCVRREAARLRNLPGAGPEAAAPLPDLDRHAGLAGRLIDGRTEIEREVLSRSYLLGEEPDVIARHMNLPLAFVEQIRSNGRTLFRRLRESS